MRNVGVEPASFSLSSWNATYYIRYDKVNALTGCYSPKSSLFFSYIELGIVSHIFEG